MSSSTFFTLLLTIAIVNGAPTSTQVSSSSVTSVAASSLNCTQLQMESDTCIKRTMLLFDRNVKFPRTTDDLDFYCNHVDTNLKCVRKYSQCLKSFPKQVFAIIMSNLKSLVKDMCSNDKVKQGEYCVGECTIVIIGNTRCLFRCPVPCKVFEWRNDARNSQRHRHHEHSSQLYRQQCNDWG